MGIVFVFIIVVLILVYFSYFAGYQKGAEEGPQISDTKEEAAEPFITEASVKNKYVTEDGIKRRHYLKYMVVFECDDGEEREFSVGREIFEKIGIGERDSLIYSDTLFFGFGEHGGAEITDDETGGVSDGGDFSYDDFDESIDIEQIDLPGGESLSMEDSLGSEDKKYLEQFLDCTKLPAKSETLEDETDSLTEYPARNLLQGITLYPFLKRESKVSRMFERTYRDAVDDMLGFAGDSRKGMAADSVLINKNEMRVVITVQEAPPPFKSRITAEFGVND